MKISSPTASTTAPAMPKGAAVWDTHAATYEQIWERSTTLWGRDALALGQLPPTNVSPAPRFLDVACGTGAFAVAAASLGFDVTATDYSPGMVARLQEKLASTASADLKISTRIVVLSAASSGPSAEHSSMTLPVMPADKHCRLLGATIASARSTAHVWDITIQQLRATLHLAALKTTDLLQRVEICKAVAMPKILFVGRHVWPSGDVIMALQRFLHNYVWSGSLATPVKKHRAWLSSETAHLSAAEGGVGMPNVREELIRLSESTVRRWSAADTELSAAVGTILLQCNQLAPTARATALSRLPQEPVRITPSLGTTGLASARGKITLPRSTEETSMIHKLLRHVGRGGLAAKTWEDGRLLCDYRTHRQDLGALLRHQRRQFGDFSLISLLEAPATDAGFLLSRSGTPLRHGDMPNLLSSTKSIGDVVDIQWAGDHRVSFSCKTEDFPLRPRTAAQFRELCDLLVFQYPALLLPQNPAGVLQPRPPTEARWLVNKEADRTILWVEPVPGRAVRLGPITSSVTAARTARAAGHAVVKFDNHPWIDPFAHVWNGRGAPPVVRSTPRTRSRGLKDVEARTAAAATVDTPISKALARLEWRRISRLPQSASNQRLLMLKIKGTRLSGWDRKRMVRGCPHCPELGPDGGHTFHIMWHCPAAQRLWAVVQALWRRLGLWRHDRATVQATFLEAVFSLKLPSTPPGAWPFVLTPTRRRESVVSDLHELLQRVWTHHALSCFQAIWAWRQGVDDDDSPWTAAAAHSALRGRFLWSLRTIRSTITPKTPCASGLGHLLAACTAFAVDVQPPPEPMPRTTADYLLFFDGGSRGNPGPGGAGSVIVRVDALRAAPSILWSAAMSLASPTTTNNQAEYTGLVTGLSAAQHNHWTPLHVVGDSAMIIGQLRDYRPPKNDKLRSSYASARSIADQLGVITWTHHLRAFNKMADAAANVAMDTRRSIQSFHPTSRPEWAGLGQLLAGDFAQWQASQVGPSSLG